jgi:hypothetical protein
MTTGGSCFARRGARLPQTRPLATWLVQLTLLTGATAACARTCILSAAECSAAVAAVMPILLEQGLLSNVVEVGLYGA